MSNDNDRVKKFARGAHGLLALLAMASWTAVVAAQAPGVSDPKACAPGERLQRGDLQPNTQVAPGETLSEKLARTEGVLCPPAAIDPEMSQRPPEGGALKIIPPPRDPGGNPRIQPK